MHDEDDTHWEDRPLDRSPVDSNHLSETHWTESKRECQRFFYYGECRAGVDHHARGWKFGRATGFHACVVVFVTERHVHKGAMLDQSGRCRRPLPLMPENHT